MSENEQPKTPLSWVKSPLGVAEIYANTMHLTWSLDDLRIRLGQIVTNPETPNPGPGNRSVSEERAAVTFTWRNAKLLRDQLTRLIASYEEVNGEIKTAVKLAAAKD